MFLWCSYSCIHRRKNMWIEIQLILHTAFRVHQAAVRTCLCYIYCRSAEKAQDTFFQCCLRKYRSFRPYWRYMPCTVVNPATYGSLPTFLSIYAAGFLLRICYPKAKFSKKKLIGVIATCCIRSYRSEIRS